MMVCDSGTRSNKVTSDSFYWGTCHWKMPFLAPEMQQVLAGILAAILWTYFQGGRMCFKKMKSDEIELLRSDWNDRQLCNQHRWLRAQDKSINRVINTTFLSIFNSSVHAAKIAVCSHKMLRYLFPLNTLNVNRDNVNISVENKSIREIQIPNAKMVKSTT